MKSYAIILIALLTSSCSIEGSLQGLYGYYKPMKKKTPELFVATEPNQNVCAIDAANEPKVYVINGKQLKDCIAKEAIVYVWKPKCNSTYCYSLDKLQKKCDSMQKELYIVAEYYDSELMGLNYNTKRPIYGIDTKHYKTNLTEKYKSRFIKDLTGREGIYLPLLYIKDGQLVNTSMNIDSLLL